MEGKKVFKRVCYFVAEVTGKVQLQPKEIQDGIWLAFPEAFERVTHSEGKSILSQVVKMLPKT